MRIFHKVLLFNNFAPHKLRFHSIARPAFFKYYQQQQSQWKFSNIFLGFGGTSLLSISWFTSSKKDNDENNDANVDKIIRDADILYNAYLIDNAYGILRRFLFFFCKCRVYWSLEETRKKFLYFEGCH